LSRSSSVENESWEKLRQLGKILINISSWLTKYCQVIPLCIIQNCMVD
jgi:hypothetical protein